MAAMEIRQSSINAVCLLRLKQGLQAPLSGGKSVDWRPNSAHGSPNLFAGSQRLDPHGPGYQYLFEMLVNCPIPCGLRRESMVHDSGEPSRHRGSQVSGGGDGTPREGVVSTWLAVVALAVGHRVILISGIVLLGLAVPLLPKSRRPPALSVLRLLTPLAGSFGHGWPPGRMPVLRHRRRRTAQSEAPRPDG